MSAPDGTHYPGLLDQHELDLIIDGDDLDELRGLCDRLSDQIGAVKARIWELEDRAGHAEWRAERSNSPIVL